MMVRPPVTVAPPGFLFVTCQVGAQGALKTELARLHPRAHLAFSRPGFLTFKLPVDEPLAGELSADQGWDGAQRLELVFARSQGFSLGKVVGASVDELAAEVWRLAGGHSWQALHVWQRDNVPTGHHGFEPGITPLAVDAAAALRKAAPADVPPEVFANPFVLPSRGRPVDTSWVLDCVIVEPNQWWIGYHAAVGPESCWPGGVPAIELPERAVSRAYLKMEEALRWSQLPIRAGDHCAEIGCAPGGASQALLDHGLKVLGIDPAEVDPRLLAEPGFTHLQMRGADVRRRVFRNTRWLTADINVAPQYTLDTVEAIVTHPAVNVQGILLTLKLSDWHLADELPNYLDRIRQCGFSRVRARQLAFNRQEVCVAASRDLPRRGQARQSAAKRHVPSRLAVRRRLNF